MTRAYIALFVSGAAIVSCRGPSVQRASLPAMAPAESLHIDGSPALLPLVSALAREYGARHPSAVVRVGTGLGSRERVEAVTQGKIDIALASQISQDDLARQGVAAHEIAKVAVVFATHAGVPVKELTERQICDIYSGATKNWNQLGGPDLPIAARTRPAAEVDATVVLAGVSCFRDAVAATSAKSLERPEEMASDLAASVGSLGMTSMSFVDQSGGRIKALALGGVPPTTENVRSGAYRLARSSFLLSKTTSSAAVASFLAFVRSPEGSRVIVANGGVPLS